MLKIQNRQLNYMSSPLCWGSLPYDYLSLCYYHLGEYNKALNHINIAIQLNPTDERLKTNKLLISVLLLILYKLMNSNTFLLEYKIVFFKSKTIKDLILITFCNLPLE